MKICVVCIFVIQLITLSNGQVGFRKAGSFNLGKFGLLLKRFEIIGFENLTIKRILVSKNATTGKTSTKTYYLANSIFFKTDWVGAYNFCKDNGMELVALSTENEANNLLSLCSANAANFQGLSPFIGAITPTAGSTTDWFWYESGEKINYALIWQSRQPDNALGVENCLQIGISSSGKWGFGDSNCYQTTSTFMCQDVIIS